MVDERCGYCRTFSYFDIGGGSERSFDDSYVCTTCVERLNHKRRPTHQELMAFFDDPDKVKRLELRVKDLELLLTAFAQRMAA